MSRKGGVIKIAMLVPSLAPVGPVNVAIDIARLCNARKFVDVTMVSLRDNSKKDLEYINSLGLYVEELHMKKLPSMCKIRKIRKCLTKYDIIHAHSFWPTVVVTGLNKDKVTTIHNNPYEDFTYEYGKIIGYIMAFTLRRLAKHFNKVITISKYVDSVININNSTVIYNGVKDTGQCIPRSDNQDDFNVVCISSLTKLKNIYELIDSIQLCVVHGMNIFCTIIGDGKLRHELNRYVKSLGLDDYVIFTGQIDKHEGYRILSQSDCLVHSSLSEGFGLVVAEAYMLSIPVIVKDIPVMSELVVDGKTGYLYSTSADFAKKISNLYMDRKHRLNMGKTARVLYEKRYTDIEMAKHYHNEYLSLNSNTLRSVL
jgi:glycosyltransferase involved in cell wall biosynthesis